MHRRKGAALVNRRQRRALGQRRYGRGELKKYAECPDCTADVIVSEVVPGIFNADVIHDDTCPWFQAFQRSGGMGVRFVRRTDDD
jgi:hypothetical protein